MNDTATPARPRFHFTASQGWLNDPNGLVFLNGEYHLYFQHNPSGVDWGNIHWGHAKSRDLVHWEELPIALKPKSANDLCFSGSAILDVENASGLGEPGNPALLVYYTATGRGECLAWSLDGGMTFAEYAGNPVIRHKARDRDPRVIRYAPGHYVIAVYEEVNHVAFYRSENLRDWRFCSRIHGFYECPELFELGGCWVLFGADTVYSLGAFDGEVFTPETLPQRMIEGDAYAGQTFSNCDRRIAIFWLRDRNSIFHKLGFNQQMSIPVELTLDGDRIRVMPAVRLPELREISSPDAPVTVGGVELPAAERIEVLVDTGSVEAFINRGERCVMRAAVTGYEG